MEFVLLKVVEMMSDAFYIGLGRMMSDIADGRVYNRCNVVTLN
jgi:hypothetical protein